MKNNRRIQIFNLLHLLFFILQDTFAMKTPGGGGYGHSDESSNADLSPPDNCNTRRYVERGTLYNYSQNQESV